MNVEGRGELTISHMLKITELSEEAEAKLIKEFPTPEVMELKPGTHKVALEVSKKKSKKRGAPEPDGHAHEHAAHAAARRRSRRGRGGRRRCRSSEGSPRRR